LLVSISIFIESSPTAFGDVRADSAMSLATDFTASVSPVMQENRDARTKKGAGLGRYPVISVRLTLAVNIRGIFIPHFASHQR